MATAAHAASRVRFRLEGLWRRARGGAHVEHVLHGCDARCVETQRLVVRRRALRCRGGGMVIVGQEKGGVWGEK